MISLKRTLPLIVAFVVAGCGNKEWAYSDSTGQEWPKMDSVATIKGETPILVRPATHEEHCAVKLAVNAITEIAAMYPEHDLIRHDPAYVFVGNPSETIPTMCLSASGTSGKCVDRWKNVPSWLDTDVNPDGLYYYRDHGRYELLLVKRYPDNYWLDFSSFLEVVIHEEVHGLGSGYAHGSLMDEIVKIIHERAVSDLPNDPECRDIRLNWWQ